MAHIPRLARQHIVELQLGIDGQALGLCTVHQGNTMEVVVHMGLKIIDIKVQVLSDELPFLLVAKVHIGHLYALLLRPPMIVLGLDLHELQVGADIGAEANLLTARMTMLVLLIHRESLCIEIGRVVEHIALPIDVLHVVVVLRHAEQPEQLGHGGDELSVRAVHQLHAAHLCQRDGLHLTEEFFHHWLAFLISCAKLSNKNENAKHFQQTHRFRLRNIHKMS